MKLYALRKSHNCRRVLATAAHLGIDLEVIEPDLASGELKTPEYLALNANGKVPTLVDGDFKLWESNAIMQYLGTLRSGNTLWPNDAAKRADITRWQFWDANHLSAGTGPVTFEKLFKPMFLKQEPNEANIDKALKTFHTFAPVLNAQLETNRFITGEELTLADFSVGASFTYARPAGLPLDEYKNIDSWLGRLDQIAAWKQSAPV